MSPQACPNCGSVALRRHCRIGNDNCDMTVCNTCKSFGTGRRWCAPSVAKKGDWITRKLDA